MLSNMNERRQKTMLICGGRTFQEGEQQVHRPKDEKELLYSRENRETSVAAPQRARRGVVAEIVEGARLQTMLAFDLGQLR